MNRPLSKKTRGALMAGTLLLTLACVPAQAQIEIRLFPPVTFRATTRPVYYDGRASYWYHGRWYFQRGGKWDYYRDEPAHLREHRHRSRDRRYEPRRHHEKRHRRGHRR